MHNKKNEKNTHNRKVLKNTHNKKKETNLHNRLKLRNNLTLMLVSFVFIIMVVSVFFMGIVAFIMTKLNILSFSDEPRFFKLIVALMIMSIFIGTTLAAIFSNKSLKPIRTLISAIHEVANGNFDVRVSLEGPDEVQELVVSFNKMAQELGSIETLRTDFINNFSHEFKTPIVSILGFAKLLKKDSLHKEDYDEYVDIIISESQRLAKLSTSVLNLSKVENQKIISEKSNFPLDEQIRRIILLLESKWSKKAININVELDSVIINGSEELLQQMWINLLDNAIKFTEQNGEINIKLMDVDDAIVYKISDNGCGMNDETKAHLFDKFYQGDKSHSEEGNGLGLALVKRIVELCDGSIKVKSQLGIGTTFKITIPK